MDRSKRKKRREPVAISDSLNRVMGRIAPERGRLRKILLLWKEMMGEEVFLNARPSSVRKSVLHVTVSDPIWQSELRYFDQSLVERINSVLSEKEKIEKIIYRVGYLEGVQPQKDSEKAREKETEVAIDDLPVNLREAVINIRDPSLRSLMTRIASQLKDAERKKG